MVAEPSSQLETAGRAEGTGERLVVEFELGGESYGVDIADIREIIRYQTVTVVPGSPELVEGIINLRGRITPIVDLRKRVGLHASEVDDATRIIVIEVDDALVGVHVDAVTVVLSITDDQLQQLSMEALTDRSDYLEGVADIDGRLIVLINLQRALEGDGIKEAPPRLLHPEAEELIVREEPVDEAGADEERADEASSDDEPNLPAVESEAPDRVASDDGGLGLRVELLEQSFEAVKPRADELVALFYDKLFEQHPAVQPLFAHTEMSEQRGKLLSALATVVASLRQPDVLVPHLEELGRRHAGYGAVPAHYEAVGTVLLDSLGEIAGELWTGEVSDAWGDAVTLVATVMIDAAAEVEAPAVEAIAEAPVAAAKKPAVKKPAAKKPAAKKPAAKKPAAKKPAAKKPAAKKPAAKKPAAKKPAAKKPAAKKPAAKKPAVAKAATKRRGSKQAA